MSDLTAEDFESDAEDEAEMVAFFKAHAAQGHDHVIFVTVYEECGECGGICDHENAESLVGTFSSWESAVDWLESLPEQFCYPIFEPFVIDNPNYGNTELN